MQLLPLLTGDIFNTHDYLSSLKQRQSLIIVDVAEGSLFNVFRIWDYHYTTTILAEILWFNVLYHIMSS